MLKILYSVLFVLCTNNTCGKMGTKITKKPVATGGNMGMIAQESIRNHSKYIVNLLTIEKKYIIIYK
jgi:hypothetical protein